MKTRHIFAIIMAAFTLTASAQKSNINASKSKVMWTGKKIAGSHSGEIKIKEGYLEFKGGNISGGSVVMDMNSMTNTDIDDAEGKKKLIGHLKSEDFFGTEKYPTATFKITKASAFANGKSAVTGTITIKGKSQNISFDVTQKGGEYTSVLKIDRSKFDVRYGSNSFFDSLGDKAIDDIFTLDIQIALQ